MKISVIGAGNMGSAIIKGWVEKKIAKASDFLIFLKNGKTAKCHSRAGGNLAWIPDQVRNDKGGEYNKLKTSDLILLAVKPKDMPAVMEQIVPYVSKKTIVLSVAAGIALKKMQSILGKVKIVRSMPNMPVQIGMGMVGWSCNSLLTAQDKALVQKLLGAMGYAIYFSSEKKLDAVTAISGSGPAYVFYFMESLFDAALKLGLSRKEATVLVEGTFLGASTLVNLSGESPLDLRKKVTSKGGTTEQAIKVFDEKKLKTIISQAVKAAHEQAGKLNS